MGGVLVLLTKLCCATSIAGKLPATVQLSIPGDWTDLVPPVAATDPNHLQFFGYVANQSRGNNVMNPPITRQDPWGWLRDDSRENATVLAYLTAENNFTESVWNMSGLAAWEASLYNNGMGYFEEAERAVPIPDGEWFYYVRRESLEQRSPVHYRRRRGPREMRHADSAATTTDSPVATTEYSTATSSFIYAGKTGQLVGEEEVLLDFAAMGSAWPATSSLLQYKVNDADPSLLAYAVDITGGESYDIAFTMAGGGSIVNGGSVIRDVLNDTSGMLEWGTDNKTLFYVMHDGRFRASKVLVHTLGHSQSQDVVLYEETDPQFSVYISKSASRRFIFLQIYSMDSYEFRVLDLRKFELLPTGSLPTEAIFSAAARTPGHVYALREWEDDQFFIMSNKDGSEEFKLCVAYKTDLVNSSKWTDVFAYNPNVTLTDVISFRRHVVMRSRQGGKDTLWVVDAQHAVDAARAAPRPPPLVASPFVHPVQIETGSIIVADPFWNLEYDTDIYRFAFPYWLVLSQYESITHPRTMLEIDMETRTVHILLSGVMQNFNSTDYTSVQLEATSSDGTRVPILLAYKRELFPDGVHNLPARPAPLLVSGYGAYGAVYDSRFTVERAAFLSHGVVVALASVRGGGELGRWAYREGRLLKKWNSFQDFIAVLDYLHQRGISTPQLTAVQGVGVGGLLVTAVANMRPDLMKCLVADSPFVDVLNTMADPSLPLTIDEWGEWGNPNELEYFNYISQYSPYDNVRRQAYPAMLLFSRVYDRRVGYWEVAKLIAKLRSVKTDANMLLLNIDFNAGHLLHDHLDKQRMAAQVQAFILYHIGSVGTGTNSPGTRSTSLVETRVATGSVTSATAPKDPVAADSAATMSTMISVDSVNGTTSIMPIGPVR